MMVSSILKFQSTPAEDNGISASLLVLPSLTTHYYSAILSHLCSEMEMAFRPRWASFHNAKISKRLISYCQALCYTDGLRQKRYSAELWPRQRTSHPWEVSQSPPGTKIVKFTTPPALSTRVNWWHAAFFSSGDEVCHQTGGSEL